MVTCRRSWVTGTAICNHTVALLFQTVHFSHLSEPVVPPVYRCTESEQQWHKPWKAVSFKTVHDMLTLCQLDSCHTVIFNTSQRISGLICHCIVIEQSNITGYL